MTLAQFKKDIDRIDVDKIAIQVLKKLNKFISDLNREQLVSGVNDDGEKLEPEYSEVTIFIKQKRSGTAGITDRVTLFGKGNLHKSIFSIPSIGEVTMGARDERVMELAQKYGDFLGLTQESIDKVTIEADKLITEIIYAKMFK